MLGQFNPHPLALQNPVEIRAFEPLPAAGAYDAAPTVIECGGFWWCRFYFVYDAGVGAVDPSLEWYYEVSPYSAGATVGMAQAEWVRNTLYVPGTLTPWATVVSDVQQETFVFAPDSLAAETFIGPPIHLAGCVERIRVYCRERGAIGMPGSCGVLGVFYVEG